MRRTLYNAVPTQEWSADELQPINKEHYQNQVNQQRIDSRHQPPGSMAVGHQQPTTGMQMENYNSSPKSKRPPGRISGPTAGSHSPFPPIKAQQQQQQTIGRSQQQPIATRTTIAPIVRAGPSLQQQGLQTEIVTPKRDPTTSSPLNRRLCARYWVFGCNLVLAIVGFGLTALGAWVRTDYRFRDFLSERYREVAANQWWNAPTLYIFSYVMIVLGVVMVVVGLFGCCGVIHESKCILTAYFMMLMGLFVACLSFFIYIWIKRDGIENELGHALDFMVQKYYQGAGIIQETLDSLQNAFRCCGNSGCEDFNSFGNNVPRSCDDRCDGCRYRIFKALRDAFTAVAIVFLVVILALLSGMATSLYLCVTTPRGRTWKERYLNAMEHQQYRPPQSQAPPIHSYEMKETTLSGPTQQKQQQTAYHNPTMPPPPYTGRYVDQLPPLAPLTRQNLERHSDSSLRQQRIDMKRRI